MSEFLVEKQKRRESLAPTVKMESFPGDVETPDGLVKPVNSHTPMSEPAPDKSRRNCPLFFVMTISILISGLLVVTILCPWTLSTREGQSYGPANRIIWFYQASPTESQETRIYDDMGVIAMETHLPHFGPIGARLLEVTNGHQVIKLATSNDGSIVDCDVADGDAVTSDLSHRFFKRQVFLHDFFNRKSPGALLSGLDSQFQRVVANSKPYLDRYASMVDFAQLSASCATHHKQRHLANDEEENDDRVSTKKRSLSSLLMFPGTQWCGPGNRALNYSDLGYNNLTDSCCREHDHCPVNIAAGDTRWNLTNNGYATWSHCYCDNKFHDCLKAIQNTASRNVGSYYFNYFKMPCFKVSVERRCREYDTSGTNCTKEAKPKYQAYRVDNYLRY